MIGPFAQDFFLEVAKGNIAAHSHVNKFGRNIEIDSGVTADIWDGGYTVASGGNSLIWVAPTEARVHAIVSTSDNDSDSGGTNPQSDGARTLRIYGLTSWDTVETSEDITLDGTNAVNTTNSYVIIHRMRVLTKGDNSSGPNVGSITATAATDSTVTARILAGQGQTQMAIYGIPSVQTGYLYGIYASANKATATAVADINAKYNPEPDIELTNFLVKQTFGLQTTGTSLTYMRFAIPKIFEGPGILKIQATSGTNDIDISAGFDLILFKTG